MMIEQQCGYCSSSRHCHTSLILYLDCAAYLCHTCQYSENVSLIGYECVTSPGNYTLGPATGVCSTPCHTRRQISLSKYTKY